MSRKEFIVVARTTFKEFGNDDLPMLAAACTYYAFFSIFPLLLLLVTISTTWIGSRDEALDFIISKVAEAVDPGSAQLIRDAITAALSNRNNTGIVLLVSLGVLAFSATAAFETLDRAINRAWGTEKMPNFLVSKLTSFGMLAGVAVLLIASVAISTILTRTRHLATLLVGEVPGTQDFWWFVNICVSALLVFAVFVLLYRFLPRRDVNWRDVWVGALLASIAWVLIKELFALYLGSTFGDFGRTYGTLGTVVALLTWIYLSAIIVLVGAEFTAETYQVRRRRAEVVHAAPKGPPNPKDPTNPKGSPWFSGESVRH